MYHAKNDHFFNVQTSSLNCRKRNVTYQILYFPNGNNPGSTLTRQLSSFSVFRYSQYSIKLLVSECILKVTVLDTVTSLGLIFLIDAYVCAFSFSRCICQTINLI